MVSRPAAALLIALAVPSPSPTPLKTITHVRAQRLCIGLKRAVYPAVGRVLQDDQLIAQSRPFFRDYVKQSASGNHSGVDLDVARLERYITPLVQNTKDAESYLNDSVFPRVPASSGDRDLLAIRHELQEAIAQQKLALNLIGGFTDTQQLGELQQEGEEYPSAPEGERGSFAAAAARTQRITERAAERGHSQSATLVRSALLHDEFPGRLQSVKRLRSADGYLSAENLRNRRRHIEGDFQSRHRVRGKGTVAPWHGRKVQLPRLENAAV